MAKFNVTPIGEFLHPWLNKPDTKYNEDGLFHTDFIVGGQEAQDLKAIIDAAALAGFNELTDDLKPADKKKWEVYYPYEVDEDEEGNETGYIKFSFKQNAKITNRKTGETKDVKIAIHDSKDNETTIAVYSGSEGRIMFKMRPIKMTSAKAAGVRLDFSKVQVTKLKQGAGGGFGEVEGGFVSNGGNARGPNETGPEEEDGGDY